MGKWKEENWARWRAGASSQRPEGPVQFLLQVSELESDIPKEVFEIWAGGRRQTIKRTEDRMIFLPW